MDYCTVINWTDNRNKRIMWISKQQMDRCPQASYAGEGCIVKKKKKSKSAIKHTLLFKQHTVRDVSGPPPPHHPPASKVLLSAFSSLLIISTMGIVQLRRFYSATQNNVRKNTDRETQIICLSYTLFSLERGITKHSFYMFLFHTLAYQTAYIQNHGA